MSINKRTGVLMLTAGLMWLGCRSHSEKIFVPRELISGKIVYVGESLAELRETRNIEEGSSGGCLERMPGVYSFNTVNYIIEDDEVVNILFRSEYPTGSPIYYIDSLKSVCDRTYGPNSTLKDYKQSNGLVLAVRDWPVGGGKHVCLVNTYGSHEDPNAALISLEIGCEPSKWMDTKPVSDSAAHGH